METPRPEGTKKSFQKKRRDERERRGDEGGLQAGTAAGGDHTGLTLISQSESTSRPPCAASSMTGKITPSADFPFVPLEEIGQIMTNYPGSRWVIARRGSHHPGFSVRQPRRRTSRSHTRAVTSCSRSHSEHDDCPALRPPRNDDPTRTDDLFGHDKQFVGKNVLLRGRVVTAFPNATKSLEECPAFVTWNSHHVTSLTCEEEHVSESSARGSDVISIHYPPRRADVSGTSGSCGAWACGRRR